MTAVGALTSSSALQTSGLGSSSSVPAVDEANLPAAIRNGTADQKKAYQAALSFEGVLVSQMTKAMMATTGMPGTGGAASSSGSDSDSSSQGDDAGTAMLKQTLPDTLATAIMNNGGLGLAQQLDTTYPTATKSTSLSTPTSTGAVSTDDAASTTPSSAGAGQGGVSA